MALYLLSLYVATVVVALVLGFLAHGRGMVHVPVMWAAFVPVLNVLVSVVLTIEIIKRAGKVYRELMDAIDKGGA